MFSRRNKKNIYLIQTLIWTYVPSIIFSEKYSYNQNVVRYNFAHLYHYLVKFSKSHISDIFLFFQKTGFDVSNKLSQSSRKQGFDISCKFYEMSKPVFLEKNNKYFQMLSAQNFTQSAKCLGLKSKRANQSQWRL